MALMRWATAPAELRTRPWLAPLAIALGTWNPLAIALVAFDVLPTRAMVPGILAAGALVLMTSQAAGRAFAAVMDWGLMVLVGVFGGMCHFLIIKGYEIAPASVLSPFVYGSIVWATLLGLVVFDNFPDRLTLVGTAIVIGSGLYIWRRETRRDR